MAFQGLRDRPHSLNLFLPHPLPILFSSHSLCPTHTAWFSHVCVVMVELLLVLNVLLLCGLQDAVQAAMVAHTHSPSYWGG
jgi:hypothetical protein